MNKNQMTIGKRIIFGFATLMVLLIALGGFSWYQTQKISAILTSITQEDLPDLKVTAKIVADTLSYRVLNLKHVISTNDVEKLSLDKAAEAQASLVVADLEDYKKGITQPEERQLAEKIGTALQAYREKTKQMRDLSMKHDLAAVHTILNGEMVTLHTEYEQAVRACSDHIQKSADVSAKEGVSAIRTAKTLTLVIVSLALLIGIAFATVITRGINKALTRVASALSDGSDQVASASGQVSAASQALAEGASEQAASLEETSSSLEELTSMVKRNAESATKAKDLSSQTRVAADSGANDMQQMQQSMAAIKSSSDDIAKIVKNIDEIAFQTNILALNAAVEAARAGEAGAGFAVVADEVRNLAQRSASAAKETAEKIQDAITKSNQGVQVSGKVAESFKDIISKARTVDDLVGEIASASNEQASGIQQVNTAVTQMDKITQSNAATAEESASAAEELNAQAASQKEVSAELLALVNSGSQKSAHHSGMGRGTEGANQKAHPRRPASAARPQTSRPSNGHSRHANPEGEALLLGSNGGKDELPLPKAGEFQDF